MTKTTEVKINRVVFNEDTAPQPLYKRVIDAYGLSNNKTANLSILAQKMRKEKTEEVLAGVEFYTSSTEVEGETINVVVAGYSIDLDPFEKYINDDAYKAALKNGDKEFTGCKLTKNAEAEYTQNYVYVYSNLANTHSFIDIKVANEMIVHKCIRKIGSKDSYKLDQAMALKQVEEVINMYVDLKNRY